MQIHNQIKSQRNLMGLSQEELAEEIFVSRQSISNWERGSNYPDLDSLLALSTLFEISLDQLVKGDIDIMKEKIESGLIKEFENLARNLALMFVASMILLVPFYKFFGLEGLIVWLILYGLVFWYSLKVERFKKEHQIETYKEIRDFMNGLPVDTKSSSSTRILKFSNILVKMLVGGVVGFVFTYVLFTFFM